MSLTSELEALEKEAKEAAKLCRAVRKLDMGIPLSNTETVVVLNALEVPTARKGEWDKALICYYEKKAYAKMREGLDGY